MLFIFSLIISFTAADLITGFFHWFEDVYLDVRDPWIMKYSTIREIAQLNQLHHRNPHDFVQCSPVHNLRTSAYFYVPSLMLLYLLNFHYRWIVFTLTIAFLGNLVHRWAHDTNRPSIISILQHAYILQRPSHHINHHFSEISSGGEVMRYVSKEDGGGTHYYVLGNYLNLIVDRIGFWRLLEGIVEWTLHIRPIYKRR